MYVQFSGEEKEKIVAVFASPQDPEVHPNCEPLNVADKRWLSFYDHLDYFQQQMMPVPTD